jgi:hypothetical protein
MWQIRENEQGFRIIKSDLETCPVFVTLKQRIE